MSLSFFKKIPLLFGIAFVALCVYTPTKTYAACTQSGSTITCCATSMQRCQLTESAIGDDAQIRPCGISGSIDSFCHSYDAEIQEYIEKETGTTTLNNLDDDTPYVPGSNDTCMTGEENSTRQLCRDTESITSQSSTISSGCGVRKRYSDGSVTTCFTSIANEVYQDLEDSYVNDSPTQQEQAAAEAERERLRQEAAAARAEINARDRANQEESGALVPCNNDCTWEDFVTLGNNIINWVIGFAALIVIVMFCVAGFKIITAGGDVGKAKDGRDLMVRSIIGFSIILLAWLIVSTVVDTFIGDEFNRGEGPSIDEFIDQ